MHCFSEELSVLNVGGWVGGWERGRESKEIVAQHYACTAVYDAATLLYNGVPGIDSSNIIANYNSRLVLLFYKFSHTYIHMIHNVYCCCEVLLLLCCCT